MSTYYYLTASLPMLVLGDPMPFSIDDFRTSAAPVLSESDLAEFDRVAAGELSDSVSAFAGEWYRAETQLRNAVAKMRAAHRSVDVRNILRDHEGYSVTIEKVVTDAYARPNPAERELSLDRLRWSLLDDLAARDAFGLSAVLAYVVRLQLAARWVGFEDEKGHENLEAVLAGNLMNKDEQESETAENGSAPQRGDE